MSPIIMGKPAPLSKEALDCLHSFDLATGKIAQIGPWNQGTRLCDIPTQTPINHGVLGGIVIGVAVVPLWQRYYRVKSPDWLAFFGGHRFVPVVTSGTALVIALVMLALYPVFNRLINEQLGGWLINAGNSKGIVGALAVFVFGTVSRPLILFGLRHLLNSASWFQPGPCQATSGDTTHGDIICFLQGVDSSNFWTGGFMTGFFPIMMFVLSAITLAIWHTTKPAKRRAAGVLMVSVTLTAFIAGTTEPLEYAFAYVAFPIYVVRVALTGSPPAIANLLGAKDGFAFSAGVIDYLSNFGKSAEFSGGVVRGPPIIIIMGLVYTVIYYFLFRFLIVKSDFKTPGREGDDVDAFTAAQAAAATSAGEKATELSGC